MEHPTTIGVIQDEGYNIIISLNEYYPDIISGIFIFFMFVNLSHKLIYPRRVKKEPCSMCSIVLNHAELYFIDHIIDRFPGNR